MYIKFKKLLDERGVSVYTVAKATKITQSTFSQWKGGKYTPKVDKLQKLADFFGVSIDYFLEGGEETDE